MRGCVWPARRVRRGCCVHAQHITAPRPSPRRGPWFDRICKSQALQVGRVSSWCVGRRASCFVCYAVYRFMPLACSRGVNCVVRGFSGHGAMGHGHKDIASAGPALLDGSISHKRERTGCGAVLMKFMFFFCGKNCDPFLLFALSRITRRCFGVRRESTTARR